MTGRKMLAMLLAAVMLLAAAVPATAEAADDFAASLEARFAEPETAHRPYARWWLAEGSHTDETLRESVKELYEAGFGGVEFVTLTSEAEFLDDETYGWGSPEWNHDTKVILEACAKYGMSVSMTGGTYWATANLPNITPDQPEAAQELGYVAIALPGAEGTNTAYEGELPVCALPGAATQQKLVSVVAAKVVSWGTPQEEIEAAYEGLEEGQQPDIEIVKHVIDASSFEVVTDKVADGSIAFEAGDDGDYMLFAFYQYGTSESYAASSAGLNYTINYFDPKGANALMTYWDENVLTDEVMETIARIDECGLYMDSLELETKGENSTKQLWCDDMLTQFSERRGYDLEKYLPLLIRETPDGIGGMGQALTYVYDFTEPEDIDIDALRDDFFQTETELYQENCLDILHGWLNGKGMVLRAENSYGKTFEVTQTVSSVDYLETESFEFAAEPDSYRNFSGAAHVYGKRLSSETGASIFGNYLWNNGYYRQIFYTQFASGIQKTVVHGYSSEYGPEASTVWPGFEGMTNLISERFNKRQPGSIDYADVNAHISRIQKALEQGVPQVDVAMLRNDYYLNNLLVAVSNAGIQTNKLHSDAAYYWTDMELQSNGYTYEYFSPYVLADDAVSATDGMVNADGVAYHAIIVMEDELPLAAAEKLLTMAKDGVRVVFVNNVVEEPNNSGVQKVNTVAASTTGSNDGNDEALKAVVDEIKALTNVRTVESPADAMEALNELDVTPRVSYDQPNSQILTALRKAEDALYLYVYNYRFESGEPYEGTLFVDQECLPYQLDTWSGKVSAVEGGNAIGGHTIIPVKLAAGDVAVYVLDRNALPDVPEEAEAAEADEIALSSWKLSVESFVPGDRLERTEENADTGVTTTEVTFATNRETLDAGELESLAPWKDIEAVGPTVSGIGTYETTFTLPEGIEGKRVTFRADSFNNGTAMLLVNGEKVPVNMDAATADITDFVKPGENALTVRVTSSLRNIALTQPYIFWLGLAGAQPDDYGMTGSAVVTVE